jgi:hypothetical protein
MLPRLGGATAVFGGGRSALLLVGPCRDDVVGVVEAGASGVFFDVVDEGATDGAARRDGAVVDRGVVAAAWVDDVASVVDGCVLSGVESDSPALLDFAVVPAVADVPSGVARTDGPAEASAAAAGSGADVQPAMQIVTTAARAAATTRRRRMRRARSSEVR